MNDIIIQNIGALILPKKTEGPLKGEALDELKIVNNGTVVVKDGKVVYSGEYSEAYEAKEIIDASNKVVSPGLVDAHTHLVFGGSREHEMALKQQGVSYLDILKQGGGILSTVASTRQSTEAELYEKSKKEMVRMIQFGTTTVEAKSGYGLDKETELKQLNVAHQLDQDMPMRMKHTFLGPHAVPKEAKDNATFLQEMIDLLDDVKDKADFADIFCETGVFTIEESRRYMQAAKEKGLKVKIHADEIDPLGGLGLAIEEGAISADHLVASSEADKQALSNSDTVAVLLPGTTFYLGKDQYADARGMIANNGAIAIATDFNPGSCVTDNLQLVMSIAALKLKLTPNEIWNAVTVNAAKAIDVEAGTIEAGDQADIVVWDIPNHEYLPYHYGVNHAEVVIINGKKVYQNTGLLNVT
ncbi:imidazolonepropionase [Mammaliicoccus sp. Dog046]|uniref:imidazolonepropionase n=1 Tax=Mammaliicoccus sp. Dog046 TaxID=3034233 RepID=UPI002B25A876|nr:imidazolonepropionase [Mammaliicoccus sp. Dog046]WQK85479.1 imidazolonepropionase [Mammaliicoccus sp. Dog046]